MSTEPSASELEQIKRLLLESELKDLAALKASVDDPARFQQLVESILPQAINARIGKDDKLQQALESPVELTIHQSVQRNPEKLANALFPIMGPAIRQSIRDSLSKIVDGFNQTLDQSISPRSIGWRVEAMMTGRSFAEVLMAKTLLYQVEQVFLIHRNTSLLLSHSEAPDIQEEVKDADMVSSMFTAIQDFVQDSFSVSGGDQLETMQVGDLTVVVRQGPAAIIAAAVRGTPTADLKSLLDATLEEIHSRCFEALRQFEGDTEPFNVIQPLLEDCLETKQRESAAGSATGKAYHWWAMGALALLLIVFGTFSYQRSQQWQELIQQLEAAPGIIVQSEKLGWFKSSISGFRDPLAKAPSTYISEMYPDATSDDIQTSWSPYLSLDPELVLQRLRLAARPPEGVTVDLKNGVASVSGKAPLPWLKSFELIAAAQAGVDRVETSAQRFTALKQQIESATIFFELAQSDISQTERERLRDMKPKITSLLETAKNMQVDVGIIITGSADPLGTTEINSRLSEERSENVIAYLRSLGVPASRMIHRHLVPENSAAGMETDRCVTFKITTHD